MNQPIPPTQADLTVDGTGLLCVTPCPPPQRNRGHTEPGALVHVIATDPIAPIDLPAWCHLTGHHYLGPRQPTTNPAPLSQQRRLQLLRRRPRIQNVI